MGWETHGAAWIPSHSLAAESLLGVRWGWTWLSALTGAAFSSKGAPKPEPGSAFQINCHSVLEEAHDVTNTPNC